MATEESKPGETKVKAPKQLILNAFVMTTPTHLSPGLWRHPRNRTDEYNKLPYWTNLAQLVDKAGFHAWPENVDPVLASGAQYPVNDPLLMVPAMAAVTKNLVFGVTFSTTYERPYTMARRFSTLDHLTEGRIAWNVVTSYLESAARNFGLDAQVEHYKRYDMAQEFMEVVYKLWESSWRDDAVIRVRTTGEFAVAGRVRKINHEGGYFKVPGPHIAEPSPQRTPFMFQAGTFKAGVEFGAKHAEAIFMGFPLPEIVRKSVDTMQLAAKQFGRDPSHIKFFCGVAIVVDETDEKARAKYNEYMSYMDLEGALGLFSVWINNDVSVFRDDQDLRYVDVPAIQNLVSLWASMVPGDEPWTKKKTAEFFLIGGVMPRIIGSAKTVVDELERWSDVADVDGFNMVHVVSPGSFEDIIEFVIPEMQARGMFRTEIKREGVTAREVFLGQAHLSNDHPAV